MTNDVHTQDFESKMDPFFTRGYKHDKVLRNTSYERWERNVVRSALSTKSPVKRNLTRKTK